MRKFVYLLLVVALLVSVPSARATIFGNVRGIVHDPQHRPVAGASVLLKSATSDWSQQTQTDQDGEFAFAAVPLGDYIVTAKAAGFNPLQQSFALASDTSSILHLQLALATVKEQVVVSASEQTANVESVTPTTLVDRTDIAKTPGADRTNALQMITDYTPGAYVTHDMLHMRGGHQVNWLIDGVPIPNTNIAANLGPVIDPKDIDYLEIQRGSYDADLGDRTYGIFNIVPRTGFERNSECDLVTSLGSFYQTNDQISCGAHTRRFAYFASLNGNRSEYGLQTPIGQVVHDAENGYGGFASFIFNPDAKNQFRLVTSLREDYYQIPIDPNPDSIGNLQLVMAGAAPSSGLRDSEREPDGYVTFSWIHTFDPNLLLTVSPFYHYNQANYNGSPIDVPVITNVQQTAHYGGLQAALNATFWKNDLQVGVYGFAQHESNFFNNIFTTCIPPDNPVCQNNGPSSAAITGGLAEEFFSDKFKVTSWLTLIAGLRQSYFSSPSVGTLPAIVESVTDPRFGIAVKVPHLNWVFRSFYGQYYQAPPLLTATNSLANFSMNQGFAFGPLHGERDREYQVGVTIPYRGWALDADNFETWAKNWLDHNNIGESNLFWPITWDQAMIQGWELTLRSPRVWHRGQFHLAYSNQIAKATSPITGGLICPPGPPTCPQYPQPGYNPVDHDQRNTLNLGFNATLPWQAFASTNVYYGSGFHNGIVDPQFPGNYLPGHTTFDLSFGKSFAEKYSVSVNMLNVANRRVELDNSLTFGGFHFNDPRQIYAEFRYRFHY
jgi:carboxypeptidase family protein/TonB-dependent receptor-like protein